MDFIRVKVAELAELDVDIIHAEEAPSFMVRSYQGEATILSAPSSTKNAT